MSSLLSSLGHWDSFAEHVLARFVADAPVVSVDDLVLLDPALASASDFSSRLRPFSVTAEIR
jgi:hypothetical protein